MGILDDDSLDERARPIIQKKRSPSIELLERASYIEEAPSPAMLEETAHWLAITDDLAANGFTPAQILHLALRADEETFGVSGPDTELLVHLFACADGARIARSLCEELVALGKSELEYSQQRVANVSLARLAVERAIDPRFDTLFQLDPLEPTELRAIFESLPPDRREVLALARAVVSTKKGVDQVRNAAYLVDTLLWIVDLVPALRSRIDTLLVTAKGSDRYDQLAAEHAAGNPRTLEPRPTTEARDALEYLSRQIRKSQRAAEINTIAQDAFGRKIQVDAPELASVATWAAAGAKRQKQIAAAVAKAASEYLESPCKLVDIVSFGGTPIATFTAQERRFCLVPGGTFEMGFSEEEEAAVRAQSEINAGCANHYELYEHLLHQVDVMRPVTHVRVGPMLVEQGPPATFDPAHATEFLSSSLFRVPSEAELEYCARGGKRRELTYRGDVVPDNEDWFEETGRLGVKGANAFGLWAFGYEPELCADVWHETLDDHPADGSPRTGDGARVVRGGAMQVYPWQSTGEWHLLLSAYRMPSSAWEYTLALRLVLGIDCGARGD